MKIVILFLLVIFTYDCGSDKTKIMNQEPCFTDRKITTEVDNLQVTCILMGDQFLLHEVNGSQRFAVCNTLENDLMDSTIYNVSGKCYEIKPNERWPGIPFQITKITLPK